MASRLPWHEVWQNFFALQGLLNFGRKASGEKTREKKEELAVS